ncbi:MAG: serine/threonine-protein kinase [bacterium]
MNLNQKFGDYLLLRRLAVGGQSEVFLAMKRGPETYSRPVVIKALPPDRRDDPKHVEMFYREAFISSRFIHPNVINVHDARMIEGDHCMLMDFISGQTVADIAQRGYQRKSPPTLKQVAQIIADACNGLNYAHNFRDLDGHQYSVVHCDISPQNLMVTYHGDTMVFDFGIAHIIGYDGAAPVAGGKYAYMSPEQLRGEAVGPRSDIFSMGVILYELCTGYRLFRRSSGPEVIKAVLEEPIQAPRELRAEIPPYLENIIMRALARNPYDRYATATDMRADLVRFLEMTAERGDLRRGIGAYVAAMFREERADIANTLSQAPAMESGPKASLTHLSEPQLEENTMELEWSGELRSLTAQAQEAPSTEIVVTDDFAPTPKPSVHSEVSGRERALMAGLILMSLIALGLVAALAI